MRINILEEGWGACLVDAIVESVEGDVIVVKTKEIKNAGLISRAILCPNKKIVFEIEPVRPNKSLNPTAIGSKSTVAQQIAQHTHRK